MTPRPRLAAAATLIAGGLFLAATAVPGDSTRPAAPHHTTSLHVQIGDAAGRRYTPRGSAAARIDQIADQHGTGPVTWGPYATTIDRTITPGPYDRADQLWRTFAHRPIPATYTRADGTSRPVRVTVTRVTTLIRPGM